MRPACAVQTLEPGPLNFQLNITQLDLGKSDNDYWWIETDTKVSLTYGRK